MRMVNEIDPNIEPEFVRDREGAAMMRISINTFRKLAEEFDAVYMVGKIRITDWKKFKEGLEKYHLKKG